MEASFANIVYFPFFICYYFNILDKAILAGMEQRNCKKVVRGFSLVLRVGHDRRVPRLTGVKPRGCWSSSARRSEPCFDKTAGEGYIE